MIKLINILKEIYVDSKGKLVDDNDNVTDKEASQFVKKLGFDTTIIKDEDIYWYWQTSNGNFIGPSSDNPESILELPTLSDTARVNYINGILRHDNFWMKKRPKEKTNYKDQDLFDETKYYFINKEGNIIALENTLDELIEKAKKNPNKFIDCMLKFS